jgi:DNA-binding NtrC family response regulator
MLNPDGIKIFVVDDEPVICTTLGAILRHHGFDVTTYTNPLEALWAIEVVRPNLVISDVSMPDLNGVELGIRIRAKLPGCRVLLFSGQAATSNLLADAKRRGYEFDLLTKPVHPRDLLVAIGELTQQLKPSTGIPRQQGQEPIVHLPQDS